MAAGRIVFDGPPDALTESTLLAIYGETDGTVDERITSVTQGGGSQPILARL
jgi:ABC-type phosphate/phosphonate transport system ATPase subunit